LTRRLLLAIGAGIAEIVVRAVEDVPAEVVAVIAAVATDAVVMEAMEVMAGMAVATAEIATNI
jgi:hypothetical protein